MVSLKSAQQLRIYQGGGQMDYSRMARKLRDKIAGFSGELSKTIRVDKEFLSAKIKSKTSFWPILRQKGKGDFSVEEGYHYFFLFIFFSLPCVLCV
jgi:hypothetical protein